MIRNNRIRLFGSHNIATKLLKMMINPMAHLMSKYDVYVSNYCCLDWRDNQATRHQNTNTTV